MRTTISKRSIFSSQSPQSCSKIKYICIPKYTFMLETIEGIYESGQVRLNEPPHNISDRSQVLVTFLDPNNIDPAKLSELIDRIETIAGISQGLEQLNNSQTRPIGDFIQDMQRKYDIQG
jgi:hypothetical protein